VTGIRRIVQPNFREGELRDAELVLELMREFAATQRYPLRDTAAHALRELLTSPAVGRVWLVEADGSAVGYIVLTFGFSLEYGGRDAFVDELFVLSSWRGRGLGKAALSFALSEASRLGVRAVHLEVERANPSAQQLYRSSGFESNDRDLMTKRLHAG